MSADRQLTPQQRTQPLQRGSRKVRANFGSFDNLHLSKGWRLWLVDVAPMVGKKLLARC